MSDSLWPHRLQHASIPSHRLPCPSPTPRVYSNSCPSSWWCHPTVSSSAVPFSSHLQSFPASGSFPMSQFFASGGQSIGVSASASVLPMNIQDYLPLGWTKKQVQCKKNFTENWREWEQGCALRSFLLCFLLSLPSSLSLPPLCSQIVLMATERNNCSGRCLETPTALEAGSHLSLDRRPLGHWMSQCFWGSVHGDTNSEGCAQR